jgi:hypothetical protein
MIRMRKVRFFSGFALGLLVIMPFQQCQERGVDLNSLGGFPKSCAEIKKANLNARSATYQIDTDGTGAHEPFYVYCDMETDGGGWTLIRKTNGGDPAAIMTEAEVNLGDLSSDVVNANAQMSSDMVNAIGTQMMAINVETTAHIWYDRARSRVQEPDCQLNPSGDQPLRWLYYTAPIIVQCPRAATVSLPSQNQWGQNVGGIGSIQNVAYSPDVYGLCFGSWTQNTTGHLCLYRSTNGGPGMLWWNYGIGNAGIANTRPKILMFVR